MTSPPDRSPCPCCGHLVHDDQPGSSLVCPVCFWEDDAVQLRWPLYEGGANRFSLVEAQGIYQALRVSHTRFANNVRVPKVGEPLDEGFRPIDLAVDSFEEVAVQENPWPDDRSVLYWWRPTFWRRSRNDRASNP
ncbi:CPCC family cysteine-rich protein [Plantactinospora endophytica]|uniref:CPCC family cysteine-rich protein n=1 Tax=Plantactinospora endophytica TaxID=673535 RepID=UPI0019406967